ncbi:hypothetical protein M0802_013925 [Mischocyttarus mexicanus]|nr:hypothetical protein M0802_013925 [Mischocyttarus mexicanus]
MTEKDEEKEVEKLSRVAVRLLPKNTIEIARVRVRRGAAVAAAEAVTAVAASTLAGRQAGVCRVECFATIKMNGIMGSRVLAGHWCTTTTGARIYHEE